MTQTEKKDIRSMVESLERFANNLNSMVEDCKCAAEDEEWGDAIFFVTKTVEEIGIFARKQKGKAEKLRSCEIGDEA